MADEAKVVSQEGALVGDEAVQGAAHEVKPTVVEEPVAAMVSGPRDPEADTVSVSETFVAMDRVITDPTSPEAVQIPDAGRGSMDLPIHDLQGPTPEQVFADAEKASKKKS